MKASTFWAARSSLINKLREIDEQIDKALRSKSPRALAKAKELFAHRRNIAGRLAEFGVEVEDHPAVSSYRSK